MSHRLLLFRVGLFHLFNLRSVLLRLPLLSISEMTTQIHSYSYLKAGSELFFYVFLWWVGENIQWYLTMKERYMVTREDKNKEMDAFTKGKRLLFNKFLSSLTSFFTLVGSAGFVEQYMRSYAPNFALVHILGKILIALQIILLLCFFYGCLSLLCIGGLVHTGVSKDPFMNPMCSILFIAWDYLVSIACISHKWTRYILCFPLNVCCCVASVTFTSLAIVDMNSFFQSYVVLIKIITCGLPYYLASWVVPVALLDQLIAVRASFYMHADWFIDKPGIFLRLEQSWFAMRMILEGSYSTDCEPYYCRMGPTELHSFVLGSSFDAALFCFVVVLFVVPTSVFVSIILSSAVSPYSITMIGSGLLHGSKVMGAMYLVTKISHAVISFIKPLVLLYQKHKLLELRMLIDEMNEITVREWEIEFMLHFLAVWSLLIEILEQQPSDAEANTNTAVRTTPPPPITRINYTPNRFHRTNDTRTPPPPPTAQEVLAQLQQLVDQGTEKVEREKAILLEQKAACAKRIVAIVEIVFDMSLDGPAIEGTSATGAVAGKDETVDASSSASSSNANPLHQSAADDMAGSADTKDDKPPYV